MVTEIFDTNQHLVEYDQVTELRPDHVQGQLGYADMYIKRGSPSKILTRNLITQNSLNSRYCVQHV